VAGADLDCSQIEATDIRVIGVDVYGLDGNNDGIGCEHDAASPSSTASGTLPRTGQSSQGLIVIGTALLVGGAALVALSRRRIARA
jgi:LPXTG-motif cell wall-anchored protein